MRMHSFVSSTLALCLGLVMVQQVDAQAPIAARVSVVNNTLNDPFSVTVEAKTNRVIVAESGALRIVEIKDGQPIELAADFPESTFRGRKVGPISVATAGKAAILVSHAGPEGKGALTRLLRGNDQSEGEAIEFDRQTVEIENFKDLVLGPLSYVMLKNSLVYVVTDGDPENGWVAIAGIRHRKLLPLSPSIPTSRHTGCESPSSIALSPDGAYLAVSQMGKRDDTVDSTLAFYSVSGKLLDKYQVELHDIVAIAYSPNRNHLFVIDHHFSNPQQGGLYKVIAGNGDAGKQKQKRCRVMKVADLSYATSMAFDDSGTLWVTTLGGPAREENDAPATGTLVKIEGLDDPFELDRKSPESLEPLLPETQP